MRRVARVLSGAILIALVAAFAAQAWYAKGHDAATRTTVASLPAEMPAFFVQGVDTIANCSGDPDLFALKIAPQLRDEEAPEHYLDVEMLKGAPLPPLRSEYVALCAKKGVEASKVGFLPYAIAEYTQRLTLCFAQYRKWPANPAIQAKTLIYAGVLAHYAEDMAQPLHTTVDFDGRVNADGASPRSGIHNKVDALFEKLTAGPKELAKDAKPAPFADLMSAIFDELNRSHALVDRVYELEAELPAPDAPLAPDSKAAQFALERMQRAATFTSSLYLTAWQDSAKIEVPEWVNR